MRAIDGVRPAREGMPSPVLRRMAAKPVRRAELDYVIFSYQTTQFQRSRPCRASAVSPGRTAQEPTASGSTTQLDKFDAFIAWTTANGVTGFGQADSAACLFVGDGGERGMLAQRYLQAGELVVEVPLRLGLTDHPADAPPPAPLPDAAPWSARLAARLLREVTRGAASPWAPYVAVLPEAVPTPVLWPWDRVTRIVYQPAADHLHYTHWVIEEALRGLSPDAIGRTAAAAADDGGLSEADADLFRWACSIVHSRTFGTPARRGGGVGVRVLLPVIDLFNHAGDEVRNLLASRASACDNCRWEVVGPRRAGSGEWAMQVHTTAAVAEGDELTFSYGERANDDLFVHYGFVPLRNPRDEVLLYESLEDAADWFALRTGLPLVWPRDDPATAAEGLQACVDAAHSAMDDRIAERDAEVKRGAAAAEARRTLDDDDIALSRRPGVPAGIGELQAEEALDRDRDGVSVRNAAGHPASDLRSDTDAAAMSGRPERHGMFDPRRIAVRAGSFVTPELLMLFTAASGERRAVAELAVGRRAWELLRSWAAGSHDSSEAGSLLRELALLAQHAGAKERSSSGSSGSSGSSSDEGGSGAGGGGGGERGPLTAGGRDGDVETSTQKYWHFLLGHYHEAITAWCGRNGVALSHAAVQAVPDVGAVPRDILAEDLAAAVVAASGGAGAGGGALDGGAVLLHHLLVSKRMILWDVLLAGPGLAAQTRAGGASAGARKR